MILSIKKASKTVGTCQGCCKGHEVLGGVIVEHKSVWKGSTAACHGSGRLPVEYEMAIRLGCMKAPEMMAA
jgi:hypothetical protein